MNSTGLVGNTQSAADLASPTSPYRADCARVWTMTTGPTPMRIFQCWRNPGLHALAVYRFGRVLYTQSWLVRLVLEPVHLYLFHRVRVKWGIELSRSAQIGPGCYIGHFGGIIVGQATIGRHCNLSQGVTIGVSGRGEKEGCPTIGDHVYVAP